VFCAQCTRITLHILSACIHNNHCRVYMLIRFSHFSQSNCSNYDSKRNRNVSHFDGE
jgi:hypothetical protein